MRVGLFRAWALAIFVGLFPAVAPGWADQPTLKVSENHRFLIDSDGKPFFYMADTAWELFHRLSREDAELYLKDRAAKHFNVVCAGRTWGSDDSK